MLKVLYWVSTIPHKRVFLPMTEQKNVVQGVALSNIVDGSGLKLKNIYKYKHQKLEEVCGIIEKFKPDVFVQCTSSRYFVNIIKKNKIKHVFLAHGVWPKSKNNKQIVADPFFQNFDLFCGGDINFKDVLIKYGKITSPIVIDTLTQFDVLYDRQKRFNTIKSNLLGTNTSAKTITLFGPNCTLKHDILLPYYYGYCKSIVNLSRVAEKNNWVVFIKPKGNKDRQVIKTLGGSWPNGKNLMAEYLKCTSNKFIRMLEHDSDPYDYYCSDIIISTARSTVEVEASLISKPLIKIWNPIPQPTGDQLSYEYGTADYGAAHILEDVGDLENTIFRLFDDTSLVQNQDSFVRHLGITFDGNANVRFLDALMAIA